MKWNILKKWMPFLAQQDLIHKLGRGPPGVELFVLSSKNVWYQRLKLLFTMTVKIDGQQEPVDIKCIYVSFRYEMLLITSILWRLPVVRAGDTWTIPFCHHSSCRDGAHRYNHDLFSADSSRGAGDDCPMYFVNSWVLGWSHDP